MYHEARSRNGGTSPGDLGRMLGDAVRLHRRIDEMSSEVKGDRDKERERERAMELAQRRIDALQEAIGHARATTLADALAQTVIAFAFAARLDEDPEVASSRPTPTCSGSCSRSRARWRRIRASR